MTFPGPTPWTATPSEQARPITLDRATLDEIEMQLAVAIRQGRVTGDWKHQARAAVRAGLARGVITPAKSCDGSQAILGAAMPSHTHRGQDKSLIRLNSTPFFIPFADVDETRILRTTD